MSELDEAVDSFLREYIVNTLAADELERVTVLLNEEIARGVAAIRRDPALRAALDASTQAQLRAFLTYMLSPTELRPPERAFELARLFAGHGVELSELLAVYRTGQQAALAYVTDVMAQTPDLDPAVKASALVRVWGHAIDWFSRSVELLIGAYGAERENWLKEALNRRSRLVEQLLAGEQVDVDEATRQLGHGLRRPQLGVVLWQTTTSSGGPTVQLESVAQQLARVLGAPQPLVVPAGQGAVRAWLTPDAALDVRARLRTLTLPADVRVALGTVARSGPAGFADTHREAVAVQSLADVLPDPVLDYAELELVCLLAKDRRALTSFVTRELGRLGADTPAAERQRATVLAYFEGGVDGAAHVLQVHRNTVRNRLAQAESLLGRPLTERRRELELALLLSRTLAPVIS